MDIFWIVAVVLIVLVLVFVISEVRSELGRNR
jgi:uncharacterized membrane protein